MNQSSKVVIIDDEKKASNSLTGLLNRLCPELKICGTAHSIESGYRLIRETNPALVFLDIEMPGGSGFDLLGMFDSIDFAVVLVTAHDQYAIKAIKFSALDYILKPVHSSELVGAVKKFHKNQLSKFHPEQLPGMLKLLGGFQKVAIPSVSKLKFIDLNQIIYLEAEGSCTNIHLSKGKSLLSTRSIKEYEKMFNDGPFFRVNRTYLINFLHIQEYVKSEMDTVKMSNDSTLSFSRKRRTELLSTMKQYNQYKG